jgi:hypothetical protein
MNKPVVILFTVLFFVSCRGKENVILISEYRDIIGIWNTQSVSWDSLGTRVLQTSPYNKLIINEDLSYLICLDLISPVENGTINIISQSSNKLELFFAAEYPLYSSYAGSHIFGFSNVELVSLSGNEMVFKSISQVFYPNMEFRFAK